MTTDPHTLDTWLDDIGAGGALEGVLRLDPPETFDPFVIGVATQFNTTFLVYDREAVINHFVGEGMSDEEAEEYFDFNVRGAWVGDGTPAFLTRPPEDDALRRLPGHTCPAINRVQRVLRQVIWRMDNPNRATRQDARDLLCEGLAALEQVRAENTQIRAAYYIIKKETSK